MGNTQVTSLHPVQVGADAKEQVTVRNESANTIFYRANPFVSSATKDGELLEKEEVTIIQPTWFVTKEQVDGEIRVFAADPSASGVTVDTADIESEAVTTAKIANLAVSGAKIAAATIGTAQLAVKNIPAPSATENTLVAGETRPAKIVAFAYTGNGAETKVAITHNMATQGVVAFATKSATKLPSEQPTTPLGKWVNESANAGTYTFTAAPGAKEEMFIVLVG